MHVFPRTTLAGEVIAVTHSADSCRITIELKGTPAVTAVLMKQSLVELGVVEGAEVCADVDASSVLVGICHN
jgi:molybdopterin-binding protein